VLGIRSEFAPTGLIDGPSIRLLGQNDWVKNGWLGKTILDQRLDPAAKGNNIKNGRDNPLFLETPALQPLVGDIINDAEAQRKIQVGPHVEYSGKPPAAR
jgi:hypothetical protein